MRISQPNYEKVLEIGKGHLFERVILAGTLEWMGHPVGAPSARVSVGLPPWANRSYATDKHTHTHKFPKQIKKIIK